MTRPTSAGAGADLGFAGPGRASSARVWSYLLGEKDHFTIDREVGDKMTIALPELPTVVRADRLFVFRAVWLVMAELGIRQFLDVGAGLPCLLNTNLHEIAQDIDPAARVVYLDDDPLVAAHCRALHVSSRAGRVTFLNADAADPGAILNDPILTSTLDLSQPVALTLASVLMHIPDALAHHIVSTLLAGLSPGSCVLVSHPAADLDAPVADVAEVAQRAGITYIPRTRAQVARFFTGLDLVEPGVVPLLAWTPGNAAALQAQRLMDRGFSRRSTGVPSWVGVGRRRHLT